MKDSLGGVFERARCCGWEWMGVGGNGNGIRDKDGDDAGADFGV